MFHFTRREQIILLILILICLFLCYVRYNQARGDWELFRSGELILHGSHDQEDSDPWDETQSD